MKTLKRVIVLLLVVLLAALYSNGVWQRAIYDTDIGSNSYNVLTHLDENAEIQQDFLCPENGLSGISIKLAVSEMQEVKEYKWVLSTKKDNNIICEGNITDKMLNDEEFKKKQILKIEFPLQKNSKDKKYVFSIKGKDIEEGARIAFYTTRNDENAGELRLNEQPQKEVLIIKESIKQFNVQTFVVFLGLALYVAVFIRVMYKLFK